MIDKLKKLEKTKETKLDRTYLIKDEMVKQKTKQNIENEFDTQINILKRVITKQCPNEFNK